MLAQISSDKHKVALEHLLNISSGHLVMEPVSNGCPGCGPTAAF